MLWSSTKVKTKTKTKTSNMHLSPISGMWASCSFTFIVTIQAVSFQDMAKCYFSPSDGVQIGENKVWLGTNYTFSCCTYKHVKALRTHQMKPFIPINLNINKHRDPTKPYSTAGHTVSDRVPLTAAAVHRSVICIVGHGQVLCAHHYALCAHHYALCGH